jgi:hypothetical protein
MISSGCQNQPKTPITLPSPILTESTAPTITKPATLPPVTPGWRRFQFTGVTMDFPPTYLVSSNEAKNRWEDLTALGMEEQSIATLLGKSVASAKIFAVDKTTISNKFVTNMMISIDNGSKAKNLDDYKFAAAQELTTEWQIKNQDKVADQLRIHAVSKDATKPVSLVAYVASSKGKYWLTIFTTATNQVDKQLPEFDLIVKSMHFNFESTIDHKQKTRSITPRALSKNPELQLTLQSLSSTDHFQNFLGNRCLPRLVISQSQTANQRLSIITSTIHRGHSCRQLTRRRLL